MSEEDARRALAQGLDEIARGVSAATVEAEMGPMCHTSFFQLVQQSAGVTQEDVDDASRAFTTLTERLMPAALVHRFVQQACANRLMPETRYADLVPGFTPDEAIAGGDAAVRLASPMKKFTLQEVLDCLRYNQADPRTVVALAHLIQLVEGYIEGLRHLVARRSPEAAEKLVPYARQWAPKNVLKFVNVALFVEGRKRAAGGPITVDQPLVEAAMDLLNHSGAFTWDPQGSSVSRIHCPAHAFLHRFLAKEGALITVLDFVSAEAKRKPQASKLAESLAFMERAAISEETGIITFGEEWSRMKLEA
jgi:hypothetical protein